MEKYVEIYAFEAIGKVVEGYTVYMLDKKHRSVFCVNDMTMNDIAEVLRENKRDGRFEFWIVEEGEADAEL